MNAGFPRQARVRARAEFDQVFKSGKRTANRTLALHLLSDARPARLGLAVSRKVSPRAVIRNRIKRVLRESFRQLRSGLPPGAYVVVVRPGAGAAPASELKAAFCDTLRRSGALPVGSPDGTMPPAPAKPGSARPDPARSVPAKPAPDPSIPPAPAGE